jgi:hypothetical protein
MSARAQVVALLLSVALVTGCARPYAGQKTLAAIGTTLLVGGSTAWIAGEHTASRTLVTPGFITALVGAGAIIGAGAWLVASIGCRVDPDCIPGEECREVPAPPGGIPYKQCVKR